MMTETPLPMLIRGIGRIFTSARGPDESCTCNDLVFAADFRVGCFVVLGCSTHIASHRAKIRCTSSREEARRSARRRETLSVLTDLLVRIRWTILILLWGPQLRLGQLCRRTDYGVFFSARSKSPETMPISCTAVRASSSDTNGTNGRP
jgi:hypothetical protein